MSGIYIKGMHAPTCCAKCEWLQQRFPGGANYCKRSGELVHATWASANLNPIPDSCPVIPVPNHGRLIDADALEEELQDYIEGIETGFPLLSRNDQHSMERGIAIARQYVRNLAPTIIPAEEES